MALSELTADMFGDQVDPIINQEPVRPPFQSESAGGKLAGDGVSVAIDLDAELAVHAHRLHEGGLVGQEVERWSFSRRNSS